MKLTKAQDELVYLTMRLDLKAREYKMLCEKLDKFKSTGINPNDEKLIPLLNEFAENNAEILDIRKRLKALGG